LQQKSYQASLQQQPHPYNGTAEQLHEVPVPAPATGVANWGDLVGFALVHQHGDPVQQQQALQQSQEEQWAPQEDMGQVRLQDAHQFMAGAELEQVAPEAGLEEATEWEGPVVEVWARLARTPAPGPAPPPK
jgi:hypothetical protein